MTTASTIARDALHIVLSFLSLHETAHASTRVSRDWLKAAASEPPKRVTVTPREWRQLAENGASPLLRHLHAVETKEGDDVHAPLRATHETLAVLRRAAHLRRLAIVLDPGRIDNPLALPSTIEQLDLCMRTPGHDTDSIDASLRMLTTSTGLTTLTLRFIANTAEVDFSPLLSLAHLSDLSLAFEYRPQGWSHLAVLKQLSGLRRLNIEDAQWGSHQLRKLCGQDHKLQKLECFVLAWTSMTVERMEPLATLPALTALSDLGSVVQVEYGVLELLHTLPRLQYANFDLIEQQPALSPSDDDEHFSWSRHPLPPHPSLSELTLNYLQASPAVFERLFRSLPHVHTLHLCAVVMESLAPLAHLPSLHTLAVQLGESCSELHDDWEACSIEYGCEMRLDLPEHIAHLAALPCLTDLTLGPLGRTHMDLDLVHQLCVPSLLLPRLIHFSAESVLSPPSSSAAEESEEDEESQSDSEAS